jgi:hypothetical protein
MEVSSCAGHVFQTPTARVMLETDLGPTQER